MKLTKIVCVLLCHLLIDYVSAGNDTEHTFTETKVSKLYVDALIDTFTENEADGMREFTNFEKKYFRLAGDGGILYEGLAADWFLNARDNRQIWNRARFAVTNFKNTIVYIWDRGQPDPLVVSAHDYSQLYYLIEKCNQQYTITKNGYVAALDNLKNALN